MGANVDWDDVAITDSSVFVDSQSLAISTTAEKAWTAVGDVALRAAPDSKPDKGIKIPDSVNVSPEFFKADPVPNSCW